MRKITPPVRPVAPRGQGMVEFALVLPLIVLLLLLAIDFGRVFFGWVGLQNAARIGANYAALHPTADYDDSGDPDRQTYEAQIAADATAINCDLEEPLPEPAFPDGTAPGGRAVVAIECDFTLITPLIGSITGNPIELNAEATFPVRSGIIGSPGGGGGGGGGSGGGSCRVVPDLDDMTIANAEVAWTAAGFLGTFAADDADDTRIVIDQFEGPDANPGECVDPTTTMFVTSEPPDGCPSPQVLIPKLVGLPVSHARSQWSVSFPGGTFDPATGSDSDVITDQTTTPDLEPGQCGDPDTDVSVTHTSPPAQLCTVPSLVGVNTNRAQREWEDEGFTTTVQFGDATPYRIGSQDINSSTPAECDFAVITVYEDSNPGGTP